MCCQCKVLNKKKKKKNICWYSVLHMVLLAHDILYSTRGFFCYAIAFQHYKQPMMCTLLEPISTSYLLIWLCWTISLFYRSLLHATIRRMCFSSILIFCWLEKSQFGGTKTYLHCLDNSLSFHLFVITCWSPASCLASFRGARRAKRTGARTVPAERAPARPRRRGRRPSAHLPARRGGGTGRARTCQTDAEGAPANRAPH
jgi:hypothetical protein